MGFRELYDAHFTFVWRSLRRLGVSDANVNDALQDVFLVVHRRLGDFEGRAKITTWLFRICLRVARDYRRRAHVQREVLGDSASLACADPDADPSLYAERKRNQAIFDAALEALDLEQRAVFVLFELENMTGDDIAETLQIPLGTVYSRLRLGRLAFRRQVLKHTIGISSRFRLRSTQ
jgi:RNA polymerase sigma-70 factor (ECF subfamily)